MNVGELKKLLADIPDDSIVEIELTNEHLEGVGPLVSHSYDDYEDSDDGRYLKLNGEIDGWAHDSVSDLIEGTGWRKRRTAKELTALGEAAIQYVCSNELGVVQTRAAREDGLYGLTQAARAYVEKVRMKP